MAQVAPFNKDRVNPIYKAGAVNINAKLNEYDMGARLKRTYDNNRSNANAPQPYFDAPLGVYSRSFASCEVGEFAFRNRDYTELEMDRSNSNVPSAFDSNISVAVMTTLNLLGSKVPAGASHFTDADARETIASRLQIFGVIVADNRENNESNLTLMVDGVFTAVNNGTKAIPPGWVIATVPSAQEVAERRGGRNVAEEKDGGRVTLRLQPYDAAIHKHTPQRVYACWNSWLANRDEAKQTYLHSYITMSLHLMSSVLGIVASGIDALIDDADYARMGKGSKADLLSRLSPANQQGTKTHEAVIERVFRAYGGNRHLLGQAQDDEIQRAGAIGEYMYAVGEHVRVVLERVVGRALTGAAPENDMDMILMQPSR